MEFDEILKFKPNLEGLGSDEASRPKRKREFDGQDAQDRNAEAERLRILSSIEADDQVTPFLSLFLLLNPSSSPIIFSSSISSSLFLSIYVMFFFQHYITQ